MDEIVTPFEIDASAARLSGVVASDDDVGRGEQPGEAFGAVELDAALAGVLVGEHGSAGQ